MRVLWLFPLLAVVQLRAGVALVDWEVGNCQAEWKNDGMVVSNARGTMCAVMRSTVTNGTRTTDDTDALEVRHEAGIPFTPLSIDLGEYGSRRTQHFTGVHSDGITVEVSFELDGIADGLAGSDDFETFEFPASFSDIVLLRGGELGVNVDNLRVETVVPPVLPEPRPPIGFRSARVLYSSSIQSERFLVGSDFAYNVGFRRAGSASFIGPVGRSLSQAYQPWWDPERRVLLHGVSDRLVESTASGSVDLVTFAEVRAAGFEVDTIRMLRPMTGGVAFLGFSYAGSDAYYVLFKDASGIRELVGPSTILPGGNLNSTPYWFPDILAARGGSFAFDTSYGPGYTGIERLVARFDGGSMVLLATEEQALGPPELGVMVSVNDVRFNPDGLLEARLSTSTGEFLVYYGEGNENPLGWRNLRSPIVAPLDVGKEVHGMLWRSPLGVDFLQTSWPYEIYREYKGQWHRVVGEGDMVAGGRVSYLQLKALPADPPLRAVIEIRHEDSSSIASQVELVISPPEDHPPRAGKVVVHSETGDLFIELDRLTSGRRHLLQKSDDLMTWTDFGELAEVRPIQHLWVPAAALGKRVFFRVEELEEEGEEAP